ncbi:hypothetical protein ACIA48_25780 [Mycobacterium sp. NPDC051804]|uniref:hypothetical protein n=1 Tax=Mycobacterium sp. NPDC051804 TaxID=3364295 RepID=UPI003796A658
MPTGETAGKKSMAAVVRAACVICGIAAFGLSLWTYMDVSMFGFPDGYVTEYQKSAETPLTVLTWVAAGIGLLFSVLAFAPMRARTRFHGWLGAFIVLVLVTTLAQAGIPWYYGIHLGLDNGVGG